ncbi:Fic family protein [Dethiosulfovibrio salsuginis]|uniref:Death on curing protein n=1 Tax=Dethiosulfovibrio salsuginis TaxID=561720 RepID=A0A1X7KI67_9BACT|nr:Fic family protein [Dethiosulfovibrio salsuginis]SMG40648.1 death on curing protein [Dethiosulfovibrio salsuginis]
MGKIIYLTIDRVIETYQKTVEASGGGSCGFIGDGKERLEKVLEFIQDDGFYPSMEEKLTHLFFSVCKFHMLQDGNKRMAIVLCAQMLLDNGYLYCASRFIREMENISANVAAGKIDKALLLDIVTDFIYEDEDESLKLRTINAIADS